MDKNRRVGINVSKYEDRRYCIWDEEAMRNLPWRKYLTWERAVNSCLTLLYWLEMGNTYTIWDERTGKVLKQFTRKMEGLIELVPKENIVGPRLEMDDLEKHDLV